MNIINKISLLPLFKYPHQFSKAQISKCILSIKCFPEVKILKLVIVKATNM